VEANLANEKSSKEVKSEALSGASLKALSTNKAELSYGAAAARRAMTPLPLPEQAEGLLNPVKVDELSRSEDVAEVKVDVAKGVQEKDPSLDQASLKAVSETDRSAKEAKSLSGSTGPRFDQELVERVLTQTKQNLRVWMDRKLVAMEIQMEPVELGKMQMRTVLEQGRIGVLLQVENAAVKELIQQQLQDMRAVLEAQGLEVAGFYVEVWQREQGGAHGEGEKTSGPKFDLDRLLADDGSDDDPKPPQKKSLIDQVA
jgi:flagellar hook-length control protein FliK